MYRTVKMFTVEGPIGTYYDVVADGKYLGDVAEFRVTADGRSEAQAFLDGITAQSVEVVPA